MTETCKTRAPRQGDKAASPQCNGEVAAGSACAQDRKLFREKPLPRLIRSASHHCRNDGASRLSRVVQTLSTASLREIRSSPAFAHILRIRGEAAVDPITHDLGRRHPEAAHTVLSLTPIAAGRRIYRTPRHTLAGTHCRYRSRTSHWKRERWWRFLSSPIEQLKSPRMRRCGGFGDNGDESETACLSQKIRILCSCRAFGHIPATSCRRMAVPLSFALRSALNRVTQFPPEGDHQPA